MGQEESEKMINYNIDKFIKGLETIGIMLTGEQIQQFLKYYELLIEKNKVMNLTAITDYDEVIEKHFLDSLQIAKFVDLHDKSLIDVGTGAGFPGIPLKIAFPNLKVVLLDSLNKRINFLNEVVQKIGLKNIETLHGRAEDYGKNPQYREQFDYCVSRAVANMSSLSEYCIPYVKKDGYFIPYKSGNIDEELKNANKAVFLLGGKIEKIEKFSLEDSQRSLVFVRKVSNTAKKYPRKAGLPTKEPLA